LIRAVIAATNVTGADKLSATPENIDGKPRSPSPACLASRGAGELKERLPAWSPRQQQLNKRGFIAITIPDFFLQSARISNRLFTYE
jgi:hypothetical protein